MARYAEASDWLDVMEEAELFASGRGIEEWEVSGAWERAGSGKAALRELALSFAARADENCAEAGLAGAQSELAALRVRLGVSGGRQAGAWPAPGRALRLAALAFLGKQPKQS